MPEDNSSPTVDDRWKSASDRDDKMLDSVIEAWKQTVTVQMHFNDICMKIRNFAITVMVAAIGLAAYSTQEPIEIDLFAWRLPIGVFVTLVGLIGWVAFWGMDRHSYHLYLQAAGQHAGSIETRWSNRLPELLLSSLIREKSKRKLLGFEFPSASRLNTFYGVGAFVFLLTAAALSVGHSKAVHEAASPNPKQVPSMVLPDPRRRHNLRPRRRCLLRRRRLLRPRLPHSQRSRSAVAVSPCPRKPLDPRNQLNESLHHVVRTLQPGDR